MYGHIAALGQTSFSHATELIDQGYSKSAGQATELVPKLCWSSSHNTLVESTE